MRHNGDSGQKAGQVQKSDSLPSSDHPEGKPHPEYRINIYRSWCKNCGICAAFCPRQCLSLDAEGAPVVDHAERCTGCRWCELHCPDFAICVREVVTQEPGEREEQANVKG
jgi:2-oxoglutarate ferredoxin oxidoreductase subunit delta